MLNPLPHNLEAEQNALGSAMIRTASVDDLLTLCEEADFYHGGHRKVYRGIEACQRRETPVDGRTVADELARQGTLEAVGGEVYLAVLMDSVAVAVHSEAYCREVAEKSGLRKLIAGAQEVIAAAHAGGELHDLCAKAAEVADASLVRRGIGEPTGQRVLALAALERVLEGGNPPGVPTGLVGLDAITHGWQDTDLIVVAGRPGMGKTAIMLCLALAAAEAGVPVLIFSLEMSKEQLTDRLLAHLAEVNSNRLRHGNLNDAEIKAFSRAVGTLGDLPLFYEDRGDLGMHEIRAIARRWRRKHSGSVLVLTDYVQLIRWPAGFNNENNAIEQNSAQCKALAKELKCPHILVSQLSRANVRRENKRPQLPDLRGSGGIEQNADLVMFLHREGYYEQDKAQDTGAPVVEQTWPQPSELLIAKQRNGAVGTVWCLYDGRTSEFTELTTRYTDADVPPSRERTPYAG